MSFKDMVARDIQTVFLSTDEFAERRTVKYDGDAYEDIPVVLTSVKEKDRNQTAQDHTAGIYLVTQILHCAVADLGGIIPEKGMQLEISDSEGGEYFDKYTIAQTGVEMGMLRIELEAYDE